MRPAILTLILTPLVVSPAMSQSESLRDLERTCFAVTDDPRPAIVEQLTPLIGRETGVRLSFLRGCRLLAEEKFGPAGAEFEKAVKGEPNEAIYHFWFGRATGEQAQRANPLRQPGLARRTKGEFEKAAALDSNYLPAREGLLQYYLAAPGFLGGSIDQARVQAAAIARLNPYRGGIAHANVAFAAKDTAGLIRAHEGLVAAFPDSATPHSVLYNVHMARKQWPLAWAAIDRLERLRPEMTVLRYAIGRAAAESGEQLDRGEASLRQYLQHAPVPNEPSPAAAHWRLGMIAEKRGDTAAARREYETAAGLDPKLKQAKEALARLK
jgi:tetratricopeptide (TPR) repeat protein